MTPLTSPRAVATTIAVATTATAAAAAVWWVVRALKAWQQAAARDAKWRSTYDLIVDTPDLPTLVPWHVTYGALPYDPHVDAVVICVLGDFKVGKTFLINRLGGLNLPSSEVHHTAGLSWKRLRAPRQQLVWVDTQGRDAPYDVKAEAWEARLSVENLVNDLAYQLSDVQVVVTSRCKMRDQEFIYSIHRSLRAVAPPSKSLLLVVHNYASVTAVGDVEAAFEEDVVRRFHVQRVDLPARGGGDEKERKTVSPVWLDRSVECCPTYHFLLAQEGSPAGRRYNAATFAAIWQMVVVRIGYHRSHDFLASVVYLLNSSLLERHASSGGGDGRGGGSTMQVQLSANKAWIEPVPAQQQEQEQEQYVAVTKDEVISNGASASAAVTTSGAPPTNPNPPRRLYDNTQ